MTSTLTVALVSEVFLGPQAAGRLAARLAQARRMGAELAVLPELPLNPWSFATKVPRDEDAEPPQGPRHAAMSAAAREAGIGLVGGAIVRDAATGARHNTALVFDAAGALIASYRKVHLPEEPGYWETSHYEPGAQPPEVVRGFALPLGVQLCSDANRPEGSHLLGARGAMVVVAPRATELASWERWQLVYRANALTSTTYVLSVNRPGPEDGVPIGGPSIAVDPSGRVLLETTDPIAVVTLSRDVVEQARVAYPGYLAVRSEMYARGWSEVAGSKV